MGKFWHKFREIFGPAYVKFRGQLRAWFRGLLWPLEKAGNPSAPVRPWGVQSAGNRQDLPALKRLEQTLLVCLLRLHWDSNLRGPQNVKHIFWKCFFSEKGFSRGCVTKIGCHTPCPSMRTWGAIPAQEGHLSDNCAIPYENMANACDNTSAILSRKSIAQYKRVSRSGPLSRGKAAKTVDLAHPLFWKKFEECGFCKLGGVRPHPPWGYF